MKTRIRSKKKPFLQEKEINALPDQKDIFTPAQWEVFSSLLKDALAVFSSSMRFCTANPFILENMSEFFKTIYTAQLAFLKHCCLDPALVKDFSPDMQRKWHFWVEQGFAALSPQHFLMTNPALLKKTFETQGQNLVHGFQNFLNDWQQHKIQMADMQAFEVGKNLAITPGKVVYQNALMQLIAYTPSTPEVYKIPLLMIPPWINKYYILDLQPENSLVKFMVDQGFTVYMISWVNPDKTLAHKSFDDYMTEGFLTALSVVREITQSPDVNAMGFCIGGTLLACGLAYLAQKKQEGVPSATFLATLVDFSEPGDIQVFIDEGQLSRLETAHEKKGYLEGEAMAFAFNLLRSKDLIWRYVIHSYLEGNPPKPFDILYWNADSTNMPYKMHLQYLKQMYLKNLLIKPDGLKLDGTSIDLGKINVPCYFLASERDHIAPFESVKAGMQLFTHAEEKRFILAESGHVAGVINPPDKKKYGYYDQDTYCKDSWWNDWVPWLAAKSGAKIQARKRMLKQGLEAAPGSYVKKKI